MKNSGNERHHAIASAIRFARGSLLKRSCMLSARSICGEETKISSPKRFSREAFRYSTRSSVSLCWPTELLAGNSKSDSGYSVGPRKCNFVSQEDGRQDPSWRSRVTLISNNTPSSTCPSSRTGSTITGRPVLLLKILRAVSPSNGRQRPRFVLRLGILN